MDLENGDCYRRRAISLGGRSSPGSHAEVYHEGGGTRQFNVNVHVTIVSAGTPVAYGRIREWAGRPEADVFWGGEPALFDDLAERKLLVPHELPEAVLRDIPASLGQ